MTAGPDPFGGALDRITMAAMEAVALAEAEGGEAEGERLVALVDRLALATGLAMAGLCRADPGDVRTAVAGLEEIVAEWTAEWLEAARRNGPQPS